MGTNRITFYGDDFYKAHDEAALRSARLYLAHLWKFIQPQSVADIGCGRGTWLKSAHELGCQRLIGMDGDWNDQNQMLDPAIQFYCLDLNQPFKTATVDLAITLEVAEHLEPSSAPGLVRSLTDIADAILFSAAYTGQEGTAHINEQPHSYWGGLFGERGYVPFDLFRPVFWGNESVSFWYRQNSFLYAKKGSATFNSLEAKGARPISDTAFMDCLHPALYDRKLTRLAIVPGVSDHIRDFLPSLGRAIKKRLRYSQRGT